MPGGLVVTQGKQQGLDGANKDASETAIEDDVESKDFDCGEKKTNESKVAVQWESRSVFSQ